MRFTDLHRVGNPERRKKVSPRYDAGMSFRSTCDLLAIELRPVMPSFDFDPKQIKLPDVKLPDVKLPDVKFSVIKFSEVKLPEVKLLGVNPSEWMSWFRVDEAKLREILEQVRSELPTTEAILLGKPQSGKSSIVRALTGGDEEMVGQGFRPHTQHTSRYAYPNDELPLLTFVDTVGLGDGKQDTAAIVQELSQVLQVGTTARLLILTVKVNDFATDGLKTILQALRSKFPSVPCLLAITCLHELYRSVDTAHPPYPPQLPDVTRAAQQIQADFAGLYDAVVWLDFTLPVDEFDPLLYGLDPFVEAIGSLLPEAESRAIGQLVQDREVSTQISQLYRNVARRYIAPFAIAAGTSAAVPLPLATMPVLTGIQISMITLLGQLYGQVLTPAQAGGLVSTIAGGFLAQTIGRELVKLIPGFGSVIAAGWATAYTWALGEAACVYFGDLMGGKTPDPKRIQSVMKTSFDEARSKLSQSKD